MNIFFRIASLTLLFILVYALACIFWLRMGWTGQASAHEWFEKRCCSEKDCKIIPLDRVHVTPNGYVIDGHPEAIPFASRKLRQTPPEGGGQYALCTRNGEPATPIICFYVPGMGS